MTDELTPAEISQLEHAVVRNVTILLSFGALILLAGMGAFFLYAGQTPAAESLVVRMDGKALGVVGGVFLLLALGFNRFAHRFMLKRA